MEAKHQILALDQGTSSTKGYLVDAAGRMRLLAKLQHRQSYPQPGWVEHDAEEILGNIQAIISEAGAESSTLGLANQGETCLAWDSVTGDPLSPAIVWSDVRTADMLREFDEAAGNLSRAICGLPLDSYFSASKFRWILDHVHSARRAMERGRLCLGTSDAFFHYRLTGQFITDATTASRTGLMDLRSLSWSKELCSLHAVSPRVLPEIVPSVGNLGQLRGPDRHIAVSASVTDQQASLVGHGCTEPGRIKITFGTGAFALALVEELPTETELGGLLPTVAYWLDAKAPAAYALDGGMLSAGSAIDWVTRLGRLTTLEELEDFSCPAVERGLVFVPALAGLGCPHWDRSASAMWIGLNVVTEFKDLCQAVLEGVAFRAAEIVARFEQLGGDPEAPLSVDGGLSQNSYFCNFLATITGRSVLVPETPDLTSLGVARLAMVGAGITPSLPDISTSDSLVFTPDGDAPRKRWQTRFADAVNRSKNWSL